MEYSSPDLVNKIKAEINKTVNWECGLDGLSSNHHIPFSPALPGAAAMKSISLSVDVT